MRKSRRAKEDFAEEIRAHLQLEADELEAAGLSKSEAERSARVAFGNAVVAQERFSLRHRAMWLEDLLHDVRFGLRTLRRNWSFTAIAVLTLAVGIGASATVFTWINAVQLQPLGGVVGSPGTELEFAL